MNTTLHPRVPSPNISGDNLFDSSVFKDSSIKGVSCRPDQLFKPLLFTGFFIFLSELRNRMAAPLNILQNLLTRRFEGNKFAPSNYISTCFVPKIPLDIIKPIFLFNILRVKSFYITLFCPKDTLSGVVNKFSYSFGRF